MEESKKINKIILGVIVVLWVVVSVFTIKDLRRIYTERHEAEETYYSSVTIPNYNE